MNRTYTLLFPKHKRGYDINSKLSNDLNQLDGNLMEHDIICHIELCTHVLADIRGQVWALHIEVPSKSSAIG